MPVRVLPLLALAAVLAGCGNGGRDEALETAQRWFDAVYEKDAAAACEEMAPTAVAAIRVRYTSMSPSAPCRTVVSRYIGELPNDKMRAIRRSGLETEGVVKNDEIGVFPVAKEFELDVILMRRDGDAWKVASTRLGTGAPTEAPSPSATPSG